MIDFNMIQQYTSKEFAYEGTFFCKFYHFITSKKGGQKEKLLLINDT